MKLLTGPEGNAGTLYSIYTIQGYTHKTTTLNFKSNDFKDFSVFSFYMTLSCLKIIFRTKDSGIELHAAMRINMVLIKDG